MLSPLGNATCLRLFSARGVAQLGTGVNRRGDSVPIGALHT
jgi:hypothetical protein